MSTEIDNETEAFARTCIELVNQVLDGSIERSDVERAKLKVCSKYASPKVPTNADILDHSPEERREEAESILRRKPVRTASGVTPVAIMTSPEMCPHGKCLYCPGGPASEFSSAQSYTGHEPAAARGVQNDYDPYGQVRLRLEQLREIGHPVEKVELILMGGTMTARSHDYQEWFVKRALQAMNEYDLDEPPAPSIDRNFSQSPEERTFDYIEDVIAENEFASIRNIGTTFETKPDWCDTEQIDRMLDLGGSKVELGVQTTFDHINRAMHRGHGTEASIATNRRLRDAAFKVGFHMMPGQPGMDYEMSLVDFECLFNDPDWRPDYLKIYPTLVIRGTRVYDMWRRDEYEPLDNESAAELIAEIKAMLPKYVRLQRVQRDIPADFIDAGVWKSNLRQLGREILHEQGKRCSCIRCREVGLRDNDPESVELDVLSYEAAGGTEHFISYEDPTLDLLIGFCRLRFPGSTVRRELSNAALVRELHVYGSEIEIGTSADDGWQHRGYGTRLMDAAETLAEDAGYGKISVISGIGAREYYRTKLGYHQDGPYVSKYIS